MLSKIEYFLSSFDYPDKNNYDWKISRIKKEINDDKSQCIIYIGTNKNNNSDFISVKQIIINKDNINQNEIKQIIKEVYFLFSLKDKIYFPKNVNFLLSNDEKNLFITIVGNNVTLNNMIKSKGFDYRNQNGLIKWIIYQITFALYILHSNNIIHNDLNPSNILIDENGGIYIEDFSSAIFDGEQPFSFSLPYASPEFLINNSKVDQKKDMWGLGVIMLELFCKQVLIFKNENKKENTIEEHLQFILSKFGVKENYLIEDLEKMLNENKNLQFKLEQKILDEINDKDAINLINHLLVFNPKERFTAREVLESDYLKEYKGTDKFDIKPIKDIKDFRENLKGEIDHKKFLEIINSIKDKKK